MDNKDLSIVVALAKSASGIPAPTSQDAGKVIKVDDEGAYGLAIDEGQNTFAGLTDTNISNPQTGDTPIYDRTTNKWVNSDGKFWLTFTITQQSAITCDKTLTEITTAYKANKNIWAEVLLPGVYGSNSFRPRAQLVDIGYDPGLMKVKNILFIGYCPVTDSFLGTDFKFFIGHNGTNFFFRIIDELPWKEVTGTLTAGQTSVVISDASITSSSTIQVFTDTGINYTAISVSTGSVTITYPAQQADVNVKVRVS